MKDNFFYIYSHGAFFLPVWLFSWSDTNLAITEKYESYRFYNYSL